MALCLGCDAGDPGYGGRTTAEWVAQLNGADARAREQAVDALGRVLAINPHQSAAVRALIGALADTSDFVRGGAAIALAKEGVRADSAIPGLAAVAGDSAHPRVRRLAFETLGRLLHSLPTRDAARVAPQIAAALAPGLNDADRDVRLTTLAALGGLGGTTGASTPSLVGRLAELTRDVDPDTRLAALAALAAAPARPEQLRATSERMLGDSAARVRVAAAVTLKRMGNAAAASVPALARALSDRDPDVRRAAAVALGDVLPANGASTPDAASALERARRDPDAAVRLEVAHTLTRYHQRGGEDQGPPEPSRAVLCRASPNRPGC